MSESFDTYRAWLANEQLVTFQNLVITTGGNTFGPVPMAGFDGLEVHVQPGTGPVQVQVFFTPGPALSSGILNAITWTLTTSTTLDVIIPANGLFAFVVFTSLAAGSVQALVYSAPVSDAGGEYHWLNANPELMKLNTAQAANSNTIFPLVALVAGPAWVSFNPADTSGKLLFEVWTLASGGGTNRRLWTAGTPTGEVDRMLMLPAQPVGVKVTNSDTVSAHSFDAVLVPQVGR